MQQIAHYSGIVMAVSFGGFMFIAMIGGLTGVFRDSGRNPDAFYTTMHVALFSDLVVLFLSLLTFMTALVFR